MPRYHIDTEIVDPEWECYIIDTENEDEPVAAFLDLDTARKCQYVMNQLNQ